jgi:hypothetical protein
MMSNLHTQSWSVILVAAFAADYVFPSSARSVSQPAMVLSSTVMQHEDVNCMAWHGMAARVTNGTYIFQSHHGRHP